MPESLFRPTSLRVFVALTAASLAISGCRCGGNNTGTRPGEITVVYVEDGVTKSSTTSGTYDFGPVPMGKLEKSKIVIKNTGLGALTLKSLEKVGGDAVEIGGAGDPSPVFIVDFAEKTLGSGELVELEADFTSPTEAEMVVAHETHLLLHAEHTTAGAETAEIVLKGKAVSGECELPEELDFGAVKRGKTFERSVVLQNTRPINGVAFIGDITSNSGDEASFTFSLDSTNGEITIKPGDSKTISIDFAPTEIKEYLALVKMRRNDGCPDKVVKLIGAGVDEVLTWAPSPLDFGYVSPTLSVNGELKFSNLSLEDVTLTSLTPTPTDYKVVTAPPLLVPAATRDASGALVAGTAKVSMVFKPTLLGLRSGQLKFDTTLMNQPSGIALLKGFGGGPDIDVKNPTLNFGRIAYFANAIPGAYVNRKLTIQNVGARPSPPDVKANLHLGAAGTGLVYWDIRAKAGVANNTAEVGELCVGEILNGTCTNKPPSGDYDPLVGIEASATKALLDVPVRVTPKTLGIKEWEVLIYSNDPDEPVFTVTIHAESIVLPPCQYEITPTTLNFGLLTPPAYKDLSFKIRNLSQTAGDLCLVSNLDLKSGSDVVFSLPAGPLVDQEIQPGASMTVAVRAWPQSTVPTSVTTVMGTVNFQISEPAKPDGNVALTASIGSSCLTISPSDLNFGTVQKDCNSATQTFTIYNVCTTPVTVNSFQMVSPAGEKAGDPSCAGPSDCPEFIAVSTAGISPNSTIAPNAAPVTFTMKYHPIDLGADTGAFMIKVVQNSTTVDYLISMRGAGDAVGLNVDVFKQDSKPKADILLVIDNSCSMADKQLALSTNFDSFIKYATTAQVDYQIGVTSTDDAENGKIRGDANNPKVLKPTTPDVENKFKQKVASLGINGSGMEMHLLPAVQALTAPIITSDNVGLLRADAVLAVVSVSDADDQSPLAVSFYVTQLLNIKGAQRASQFSFNAIAPLLPSPLNPSTCGYDGAGLAPRDVEAVMSTAGVRDEICTPDWSKALEKIGKNAFGYRTNFFLTATPDLTGGKTIKVMNDTTVMDPVDVHGSLVWTYDPIGNAINFEPLFVPEPGRTLTITYYVACIP